MQPTICDVGWYDTNSCDWLLFFYGLINASFYIEMLEVCLIPQLRNRALMEAVCLLA